jgi:hypothetical protein
MAAFFMSLRGRQSMVSIARPAWQCPQILGRLRPNVLTGAATGDVNRDFLNPPDRLVTGKRRE